MPQTARWAARLAHLVRFNLYAAAALPKYSTGSASKVPLLYYVDKCVCIKLNWSQIFQLLNSMQIKTARSLVCVSECVGMEGKGINFVNKILLNTHHHLHTIYRAQNVRHVALYTCAIAE